MKKINENFCGYIKVEGDTYTYNVSDNIVTLLPAQSDASKRYDCLYRIKSHNTDTPEYLFGEDDDSMIAILRKGKFVTNLIGTNVAIKFATPIIIKAYGNAQGFFSMLTEDWCKFHAITFCGGNINALYTPDIAIEQSDNSELLKYDGARTIKMRSWSDYTRTTEFQIENEKVTLTVSVGQTAETNNADNRGAYNLGKMYTFFQFSFENAQDFEMLEKYYIIARKLVAILTSQNNVCFEEVYLSQRNSEDKYFKTGICKIFDPYENYSIRQWRKVIPILSVFDYMPNLINGIVNGKVDSLLELLPEDNKMVNRISIKNVQDLCTALEVSYHLDDRRKREKDALIEELKKNIKNTIAKFVKVHNEIDVNRETTISSAFRYLDYTLKQKILALYNENSDVANAIISKYSLPEVNENSIASFAKLRDKKTHSGTVEWGESAQIYTPLFAIVYASFVKYIELPDEVIKSTLLQIF